MEADLFIVRVCRVPVPFPVASIEVDLNRSPDWFLAVYTDRCVDKIRSRHSVPDPELDDLNGLTCRSDKSPPKFA